MPLIGEVICHNCPSGFPAAGELAGITDSGRPVDANVPLRVAETGKLSTFFLNSATEKIDCGAKYHSAEISNAVARNGSSCGLPKVTR